MPRSSRRHCAVSPSTGRTASTPSGDSAVKVFDADGKLLQGWKTGLPGFSVAVDDGGHVWVGQWKQVEIFDAKGQLDRHLDAIPTVWAW